jgi:hypothetical protein
VRPTGTPIPSIDVRRTPKPIPVDADVIPIDVADAPPEVPIVISGSGLIEGTSEDQPAPLHFGNVTIASGDVTAKDLIVESYLELRSGTSLKPPAGESLSISAAAEVKLSAPSAPELPLLDLGATGGAHDVVPRAVTIDLPPAASVPPLIYRLLVRGNPFDKCNDWRLALVGIPAGTEAVCQAVSAGAARAARANDVGLYLRAKEAGPPEEESGVEGGEGGGGGFPIAIIGAVAGVVTVIIVVIAVVIVMRGRTEKKESSPSPLDETKAGLADEEV